MDDSAGITAGSFAEVDPRTLQFAEWNPRVITPAAMAKLKAGLREFGMPQPVIVNIVTGNVVGGHQRAQAAIELGWEKVPVTYVELDEDREKALNILLNNPDAAGQYDRPKLARVLQDLGKDDFLLEITGLSSAAIQKTLDELRESADPVYPLVPRFLEKHGYVVVIVDNETDLLHLKSLFGIEQQRSYKAQTVGEGLVVTFAQFMERIGSKL